eukprot:TRINITY_DN4703_c0_g1_i2.p1 TRINITY_DN4703_c0_g1~~TRINITY_DN4703_c0_g1_i2.p1  ORF type:complete len:526 (-),score=30.63 TRINITY_DN4703_c0_g1_i2:206-1783(-)
MFTPFSYDWYHEDSTSASTDDFDYFLEDTLSVETEDEFSEPFSHIGSPVASRFNSWNQLPFNGFEDHKEPLVPNYQANVLVHSDSESNGFVHSDEQDFPLDTEKHQDSDPYYVETPTYPLIKNEEYEHPKHDFLVPPKPLRTSRSHSHPSLTHSIPTTPNMQPTHTFQFSNDLQTYSPMPFPSPSHTPISSPSPLPQYVPPQIIPKTKFSPPSHSSSYIPSHGPSHAPHAPSHNSSYTPCHTQSHMPAYNSNHPPSHAPHVPNYAPSHPPSHFPSHPPSHFASHHPSPHHPHPCSLPPSHPKPYVHHSFFQPNQQTMPHPFVKQGSYQPALDLRQDSESSADSFLSDSCLEGAESDYNRSSECTPINSPSQSGFLEETHPLPIPNPTVETKKRVRTTGSSESTDDAIPTKIPKTKPSSFPRKKFRETIGNQIYQDLVSEKFSYDEIIAKYSTLYPEYAHKFTPSFCSKVRCGRIMNTEAKVKAKEAEIPKSRIKRVSRLSHRKTWRKMTPELVRDEDLRVCINFW